MRNPVSFLVQNVVNPNNDEESQRIAVKFDNCQVIRLYLRDQKLEDVVKTIKADKPAALKKVVVLEGEFGEYCILTNATTVEEI